ncbi:MAG: F0F1 ATP synthase subunit A [candidate division Zixibacteria bacterium]|jgi:F-type H+-transporting ATPase subunit a|nr:F0F1 ATP synthase subunit A [candidate division Zixibacteria bacterium]
MIFSNLLTVLASAGGEHAGGMPELPHFIEFLHIHVGGPVVDWMFEYKDVIFGLLVLVFMCVVAMRVYAKRSTMPGPLQNLIEMIVEGFESFFSSILGEKWGRHYTPFLGTLFMYILLMNWFGLIPFGKSATANWATTAPLAIVVFLYVQYTGIRRLGIVKYVDHLMGEPRSVVTWVLVPLNLPIHIIGELAKPLSLSLRLFGNITGEDVLLAAFTGLGVMVLAFMGSPVGIPLQLPFYFLALLTSTIQALVFTLLAAVYFSMMLPHEEHEEH